MNDRLQKIKATFFYGPAILCLLVFTLDQVSKVMTVAANGRGEILKEVIPNFFNLVDYRNPGAAWGILGNHTPILAGISIIAFLYLLWDFENLCGESHFRRYTLATLMGGIIGNFIDRGFREGGVVDMLQVYIPVPNFAAEWSGVYSIAGMNRYIFPAFNVADSAICVATFSLLIASFFIKDELKVEKDLPKKS